MEGCELLVRDRERTLGLFDRGFLIRELGIPLHFEIFQFDRSRSDGTFGRSDRRLLLGYLVIFHARKKLVVGNLRVFQRKFLRADVVIHVGRIDFRENLPLFYLVAGIRVPLHDFSVRIELERLRRRGRSRSDALDDGADGPAERGDRILLGRTRNGGWRTGRRREIVPSPNRSEDDGSQGDDDGLFHRKEVKNGLFGAQGVDGFQLRGLIGGKESEHDADHHRTTERQHDRIRGDDGGNSEKRSEFHDAVADRDAYRTSEERQYDGFRQELHDDVGIQGSNGAAYADFAGTFGDGDEHDVHDSDTSDDQGNRSDSDEEDLEGIGHARHGGQHVGRTRKREIRA